MARTAPVEDRNEIKLLIGGYGHAMAERSVLVHHPSGSKGEQKAAVAEMMYRNDFTPEEMVRVKQSCVDFYDK